MTATKTSPATTNQRAPTPSAGVPPPAAPGAGATDEPSIGAVALDSAANGAAVVADTFLTTTGLRPAYELQKGLWHGAARVWNGEPATDVMLDTVVPRPVREAASLLRGVDTMKQGEALKATFEATGVLEGLAGRREVEVSIERGEHGFTVALADAGALGLLAAEDAGGRKAEASVFGGVGGKLAIEVATLDEAKALATELAVAGTTSIGALIEGYQLTNPGLREIELAASAVFGAGIGLAPEDQLAELGLEGAVNMGASAKFVAGSPPELVVSSAVALEGAADVSLVLGGANLGRGADAEGKVTRERHFALPQGTTPADLPGLLARGQVSSQEPRVQWAFSGSVSGLDGKQLAIEGTLHVGEHGVGIEEGVVEWRSCRRLDADAGELHHSTGAEAGVRLEQTMPLRREQFSSAQQLERALRSMQAEMTRAI